MSTPILKLIPSGYKYEKVYNVLPTSGIGDFSFTRATKATRVNSRGLIEAIETGIPRLDHYNGSCPSLLLETQRTNKVSTSNDFNGSGWSLSYLNATPNQLVSPDGTLNASKLEMNGNGHLRNNLEASFNIGYAYSIFIKKGNSRFITIRSVFFTQSFNVGFDLDTLTAETNGKIENYGNDWYRLSISKNISTDADKSGFFYVYLPNSLGSQTSVNGNYAYFYGGQIEDGNFISSYIPTINSAVTRLKETVNNSGNLNTIANTNTVVLKFIPMGFDNNFYELLRFSDGTNQIALEGFSTNLYNVFGDGLTASGMVNGGLQLNEGSINIISFSYSGTSLRFSHNGNTIFTTTPTANLPTITEISHSLGGLIPIKILALDVYNEFKTQQELNSLTTI
jgi:hypothetical protein|tara:strand:- start:1245 stop:2429 length:1185 start_codon:yes stop_codon:yes gene_type:complete